MKNVILTILLIIASNVTFSKSLNFAVQKDTAQFDKNSNYHQQIGLYEVYKDKQYDIVMLGNSITQGVNWMELLGRTNIANRGISSDILEGFTARIEYIYKLNPKYVFIMGGINDIYNRYPIQDIFKNYTYLISLLKTRNINVVVQSTLYVNPKWKYAEERNKEVENLNNLLESYCKNNNIEFIDLNKKLSKNKVLNIDYTYDGLHLNGKGYKIWGEEVEKMLKKFGY
ncbi:MAG TPA: GDSL-type esterase/lipase family protein [Ignavibacteriaceae bacterium]|nr:GDSL-type esterase/lipase family protein [Ignavibacteriaceae bacterium]